MVKHRITVAAAIAILTGVAGTAAGAQPSGPADATTLPRTLSLLPEARIAVGGVPTDVVATPRDAWVATGMGGVVRVDGTTNRLKARIRTGGSVSAVAVGLGAVWALDIFADQLVRIDPATNRVVRRIRVDPLPSGLAIGHGLVWIASQLGSTVAGIDPRTSRVVKLALFKRGELWPGGLAVGEPGVWVVTGGGTEVSLFDPAVMRFRYRIRVPDARTVTSSGRDLWVGLARRTELVRIRAGRLRRFGGLVQSNGYGPQLSAGACVWVIEPHAVAALDPATGALRRRYRTAGGRTLGRLSVAGDVWLLDTEGADLLRLDTVRSQKDRQLCRET
jgi:hypothetical protein